MSTQTTKRTLLAVLCLAVIGAGGCKEDEPAAGLVLSFQTDMSVPKDVDEVRVEVSAYGNLLFGNNYEVGPSGLRIPATLAIAPGEDAAAPVRVRLIAFQNGRTRVLREAVTTVPQDRIGLMRMPIQWLCDGQVNDLGGGEVESSCGDGQTCVAGRCRTTEVPMETLPVYIPAAVFGGGDAGGGGSCFDTLPCFESATVVGVDTEACTFPYSEEGGSVDVEGEGGTGEWEGRDTDGGAPAGKPKAALGAVAQQETQLNVGLLLGPGSDGICDEQTCIVPLDRSSDPTVGGWTLEEGYVQLPEGLCGRIAAEGFTVVYSEDCAPKDPSDPTCGPWSSVGSSSSGSDAAAPCSPGDPSCDGREGEGEGELQCDPGTEGCGDAEPPAGNGSAGWSEADLEGTTCDPDAHFDGDCSGYEACVRDNDCGSDAECLAACKELNGCRACENHEFNLCAQRLCEAEHADITACALAGGCGCFSDELVGDCVADACGEPWQRLAACFSAQAEITQEECGDFLGGCYPAAVE